LTEDLNAEPERYKPTFKEIWEQKGSKCTAYADEEQQESAFAATLTAGADTGFPSFQGKPFNHLDFRAAYDPISHSIDDGKGINKQELSNLG
jgi:hypothetical protein